MVTGNEKVFDNIDLALAFIINEEKKYLNIEERKRKCSGLPLLLGIPIDSLKNPFSTWDNNGSDEQFVMTPLGSGRYSLKPNLRNRGFLFRGESEFHLRCKPSLFRKEGQERFTKELLQGQEMSLIMMKHPLVELLDSGVTLCGRPFSFGMDLFGLSQHYSNKTSLMDLTSDPRVATFFAITEYDDKTDTFKIVDKENHSPGVLYYYELDEVHDFKGNSRLTTIGLQVFPRSGRQKGFLYRLEPDEDFNNIERLRAVKFKHNKEIAERIYKEFDGGKTLFPDDILSAHWNKERRASMIISNRTIRLNMHFNRDLTQQDIELEAGKLGFTIKDYQPSFTREEIDKYYEEIKNGMWQSVCDNIYIPGDINGRIKADLMNLPNRSEYKWAFESGHNHTPDYNKGYLLKQYRDCLE